MMGKPIQRPREICEEDARNKNILRKEVEQKKKDTVKKYGGRENKEQETKKDKYANDPKSENKKRKT
jgi:hypothetical protein